MLNFEFWYDQIIKVIIKNLHYSCLDLGMVKLEFVFQLLMDGSYILSGNVHGSTSSGNIYVCLSINAFYASILKTVSILKCRKTLIFEFTLPYLTLPYLYLNIVIDLFSLQQAYYTIYMIFWKGIESLEQNQILKPRCCKHLIFQTQIIWSNRIHSLKYLRSSTFGFKE